MTEKYPLHDEKPEVHPRGANIKYCLVCGRKTIMSTVNDIITIMQKVGIGAGLPRPQYLDYYRKIKEGLKKPSFFN